MAASTVCRASLMLNREPWLSTNYLPERSQLFSHNTMSDHVRRSTTFFPAKKVQDSNLEKRGESAIVKDDSATEHTCHKAELVRKSTTLYPMRVCASTSTSRWEREQCNNCVPSIDRCNEEQNVVKKTELPMPPQCYNFGSLVKDELLESNHKISSVSATEYGHSSSPSIEIDIVTGPTIELESNRCYDPCLLKKKNRFTLPSSSFGLSTEFQVSPNKKRLSLGRIPNNVRCYSCERRVKEDNFSEHLIFGTIRCSVCSTFFRDCQSFQVWISEHTMGNVSCNHNFSYVCNPVNFITARISEDKIDENTASEELMTSVEKYIHKLRSLQTKQPWKYAIETCKEYLKIKKAQCSSLTEENLNVGGHISGFTTRDQITTNDFYESTLRLGSNSSSFESIGIEKKNGSNSFTSMRVENYVTNFESAGDKSMHSVLESGERTKNYKNNIEITKNIESYSNTFETENKISSKPRFSEENIPIENKVKQLNSSGLIENSLHDAPCIVSKVAHSLQQSSSQAQFDSSNLIEKSFHDSPSNVSKVTHSLQQSSSQIKSDSFSLIEKSRHDSPSSVSKVTYSLKQTICQPHCSWQYVDVPENTAEEQFTEYLCSESYDLGHLDAITEFAEVSENTHTVAVSDMQNYQDIPKKKANRGYKRKKGTLNDSERNCSTNKQSLRFVSLPEDGFYFVSKLSVEECPNCYEVLCPSQFTVNIKTFLLTTICVSCSLTIYIVNENVKILTEGKEESIVNSACANRNSNIITKKKHNRLGNSMKMKIKHFFL